MSAFARGTATKTGSCGYDRLLCSPYAIQKSCINWRDGVVVSVFLTGWNPFHCRRWSSSSEFLDGFTMFVGWVNFRSFPPPSNYREINQICTRAEGRRHLTLVLRHFVQLSISMPMLAGNQAKSSVLQSSSSTSPP